MTTKTSAEWMTPWKMKKTYLESAFYDHTLIFGVMALAIMSGVIVLINPALFVPVLFLDLWFLGYHHVISTFTKLAGTKQDRKDNKFLIYYLPFIVLAGVIVLYQLFGIWSIVTVYFFWQWFHYTRQAYGISAFYKRKSGDVATITPPRLDYAVIWAIPIWGVVHRCAQGWDTFIFQPVWLPPIPFVVDVIVGAAALCVVAFWLVTKFADWSKGQLCYAPFMFVLSHQIIFLVGYVLIGNITIGWLVANVWHNAQYILFVWLFNQNRFQKDEMKEQSPILHWLCQRSPYRIFAYFAACLLVTTIVYSSLQTGVRFISQENTVMITALMVIIFQTVNFHHYVVDSFIWKARKKSHQKIMKINE